MGRIRMATRSAARRASPRPLSTHCGRWLKRPTHVSMVIPIARRYPWARQGRDGAPTAAARWKATQYSHVGGLLAFDWLMPSELRSRMTRV
jgi:hypothetical protein